MNVGHIFSVNLISKFFETSCISRVVAYVIRPQSVDEIRPPAARKIESNELTSQAL